MFSVHCCLKVCRSHERTKSFQRTLLFKQQYGISDCYNVAMLYRGTAARTTNGKACQKWSDNSPQKHEYHDDSMFPDGSVASAYNYCRAPDNRTAPWCYTEDEFVRWDYCDVQMCDGML